MNKRPGRRVALIVGVDQYADPDIRDLSCAESDCIELQGLLRHAAGFEIAELVYGQRLEGHSMRSIGILAAVLNDMGIQASAGGERHAISRADVEAAMQELPQPLSAAESARYRKFGET